MNKILKILISSAYEADKAGNKELADKFDDIAKIVANKSQEQKDQTIGRTAIDGMCMECQDGKYRFIVNERFFERYAGQVREIMSPEPCSCGSHLWLITIPPVGSRIDEWIGE